MAPHCLAVRVAARDASSLSTVGADPLSRSSNASGANTAEDTIAARDAAWKEAVQLLRSGEVKKFRVIRCNKGGIVVQVTQNTTPSLLTLQGTSNQPPCTCLTRSLVSTADAPDAHPHAHSLLSSWQVGMLEGFVPYNLLSSSRFPDDITPQDRIDACLAGIVGEDIDARVVRVDVPSK